MSKWQKIFEDPLMHKATIIKDILGQHNINAIVLPTMDTSYNSFGTNQVLVEHEQVLKAIKIIADEVKFE